MAQNSNVLASFGKRLVEILKFFNKVLIKLESSQVQIQFIIKDFDFFK